MSCAQATPAAGRGGRDSGGARAIATHRHLLAAGVALATAYAVLRQPTWSLDGAIHALASVGAADEQATGHLLLRGLCWAWTSVLALVVPMNFAARYVALEALFALFGIAALLLLFRVALRRAGPMGAWLALAAVAITRDAERQITNFDEKPLGMLLFAVAVAVTDRTYRALAARDEAPTFRDAMPLAAAWLLACFGHLQNAPFALAAVLALPYPRTGAGHLSLRLRLLAQVAGATLVAALALFALLYAAHGGLGALPRLVHFLLEERAAPVGEHQDGFIARAVQAGIGLAKGFFLLDRLTPKPLLAAALAASLVVAAAVASGSARAFDALGRALALGAAMLIALVPIANYFPDYGDSFTMVVMAATVLLASAPRRLLAASAVILWAVNLPAAWGYAHPETTMQRHLERMVETQQRLGATWVLVKELTPFTLEQGLAPLYYRTSEPLAYRTCPLDTLPEGRFLVELPQVVETAGGSAPGRVRSVQQLLAGRGRRSEHARLWDPLRLVRSDFRRYGDYLIVEPAPGLPAR